MVVGDEPFLSVVGARLVWADDPEYLAFSEEHATRTRTRFTRAAPDPQQIVSNAAERAVRTVTGRLGGGSHPRILRADGIYRGRRAPEPFYLELDAVTQSPTGLSVLEVKMGRPKLRAAARKQLERFAKIEEAIATMTRHYLTQPSGAHAVKEGLLGLRKVGDLSEDQLIRVLKGLGLRDWLREWFPSEFPVFERMAQTALTVKKVAHSQQAMVEYPIDLAEELPTDVTRDAYRRAVVYLLHRKSLARLEVRFLLLWAGFMQQADSYAPIVHEEVVTGEADAEIDDWWRL